VALLTHFVRVAVETEAERQGRSASEAKTGGERLESCLKVVRNTLGLIWKPVQYKVRSFDVNISGSLTMSMLGRRTCKRVPGSR
jgi:hypothetical protein